MNNLKNILKVSLLIFIFMLFSSFIFISAIGNSKELIANIGFVAGLSENAEQGVFVDIVKGINKYYKEGKITIQVVPFLRGVENLLNDRCDFYFPVPYSSDQPDSERKYRNINEKFGSNLAVVIYSHVDKVITAKMINDAVKKGGDFPFKFESVPVSDKFFTFPTTKSFSVEASLKKIDDKRIDGALFVQDDADVSLRNIKLKNIHRELLKYYDDVIVIKKGPESDKINEKISKALKEFKKTKEYTDLYSKIHPQFTPWQPKDMGW